MAAVRVMSITDLWGHRGHRRCLWISPA